MSSVTNISDAWKPAQEVQPAQVPANGEPQTLAETIDHEALSYRERGDSIGKFIADHLDRLAQLVRWTDASTPEEHEQPHGSLGR